MKLDDALELAAVSWAPADEEDEELVPMVSPTEALTAAIVPDIGAPSRVALRAFCALVTASSAVATTAAGLCVDPDSDPDPDAGLAAAAGCV